MSPYDEDIMCIGCGNKSNSIYDCLIRFEHSLVDKCPCVRCLVKAMCIEHCMKRAAYFETLRSEMILVLEDRRIKGMGE